MKSHFFLRFICISFVLVCGVLSNVQASQGPQQPKSTVNGAESYYGRPICAIKVKGNERTLDATVQRIAHIKLGTRFDEDVLEQAQVNLKKSGIFAEVSVHVKECSTDLIDGSSVGGREKDGVTLIIEVEDKWTLIPVPFFSTDGSSVMGGLIVIESNLLGTGKQLISGAMGGTDGLSGFAVFADPALFQSRWRFSVSGSGGVGDEEIETPDGEEAYSFNTNTIGISFGLGYQFTNEFRAGLRTRIEQHDISSVKGISPEKISDAQQDIELRAQYDATVPYGSLLKGFEASAEAAYSFISESSNIGGKAAMNIPTFSMQRLRLLVSGGYGDVPYFSEKPVSGRDGFRTLPFGKVTADDYWSSAIAYDVPVLTQDWGAMVISSFYEHGWYRSSLVDEFDFYGPGAGFRVYLRKIAVPALGVDVAYNLQSDQTIFSVAIGMQM